MQMRRVREAFTTEEFLEGKFVVDADRDRLLCIDALLSCDTAIQANSVWSSRVRLSLSRHDLVSSVWHAGTQHMERGRIANGPRAGTQAIPRRIDRRRS